MKFSQSISICAYAKGKHATRAVFRVDFTAMTHEIKASAFEEVTLRRVISPYALPKNEEKAKKRKERLISPLDLADYEGKTRASLNI